MHAFYSAATIQCIEIQYNKGQCPVTFILIFLQLSYFVYQSVLWS